jgi:hypothetical protein
MFRPFYGSCNQCPREDVLIVVKSGICQYCNHENKQKKRKSEGKKPMGYKYSRQKQGEVDIYEKVLENLPDYETRCFVCGIRVSVVTHNNMAHVLNKNKYPKFRLNPDNYVILCHRVVADADGNPGCHYRYDMTPHSTLKGEGWERLFALREDLKAEYKRKYEE